MTGNGLAALLARLQGGRTLWTPPGYSEVQVRVTVEDIRRVFNRLDVRVRPAQGSGTVWVSLETISGVPFE